MPMKRLRNTPVLIVGAGPVGLSLAVELGLRGIECTVVDRTDGVLRSSKMNLVNIRTMEHCRRWGIAERVRGRPFPADFPHDVAFVTSLAGTELSRLERPADENRTPSPASPETFQHCPQIWFDPILQALASELEPVTLVYRHRLEALREEPGRVAGETIDLQTGESGRIAAEFAVGCDGGSSDVRRFLEIPAEGSRVLSRSYNVFIRCPQFMSLHDKARAIRYMLVDGGGIWGTIVAIDGREIWRLSVADIPPDSDPDPDETDAMLCRALGVPFEYELLDRMVWSRRKMVPVGSPGHMGREKPMGAGRAAHGLDRVHAIRRRRMLPERGRTEWTRARGSRSTRESARKTLWGARERRSPSIGRRGCIRVRLRHVARDAPECRWSSVIAMCAFTFSRTRERRASPCTCMRKAVTGRPNSGCIPR